MPSIRRPEPTPQASVRSLITKAVALIVGFFTLVTLFCRASLGALMGKSELEARVVPSSVRDALARAIEQRSEQLTDTSAATQHVAAQFMLDARRQKNFKVILPGRRSVMLQSILQDVQSQDHPRLASRLRPVLDLLCDSDERWISQLTAGVHQSLELALLEALGDVWHLHQGFANQPVRLQPLGQEIVDRGMRMWRHDADTVHVEVSMRWQPGRHHDIPLSPRIDDGQPLRFLPRAEMRRAPATLVAKATFAFRRPATGQAGIKPQPPHMVLLSTDVVA